MLDDPKTLSDTNSHYFYLLKRCYAQKNWSKLKSPFWDEVALLVTTFVIGNFLALDDLKTLRDTHSHYSYLLKRCYAQKNWSKLKSPFWDEVVLLLITLVIGNF